MPGRLGNLEVTSQIKAVLHAIPAKVKGSAFLPPPLPLGETLRCSRLEPQSG